MAPGASKFNTTHPRHIYLFLLFQSSGHPHIHSR